MSAETDTFKIGSTVYPMDDGYLSGNSTLQDMDPVIFAALKYFSSVLQTYLGSRWNRVAPTSLANKIVNHKLPYAPSINAFESAARFPMLSIYRVSSTIDEKSISYSQITSQLKLAYVLPPYEAGTFEKMNPFLYSVAKVISDRCGAGKDGYFNSGEEVWNEIELQSIRVVRFEFGDLPNENSNLYFPTLSMDIECREIWKPVDDAYDALAGVDLAEDITDTVEETVADFVEISKELI